MTIKSATPSGSQRERAPTGERPWFKADIDDWGIVRDLLPRPWPARLCALDLRYMEARERFCKTARDGQTVLQARWGLSATAVKKHLRAFAALTEDAAVPMGCPERAHGVPMGCLSEPHQADIPADEVPMGCPEGAHGVPMGCPEPVENAQQVALLEPPKRESETESETENTSKPAKAGLDLQALLNEMHAVELAVRPKALPPRLSSHEKAMRRTIEGLKQRAREDGTTPVELMMAAWRWWWSCAEGWHRTNLPGAKGYKAFFQAPHVIGYLDRMRDDVAAAAPATEAPAPKPKTPGEVAWDRWMQGLDVARAWYAANKGTREGDAFHAAMEAACKPNPIAELFGGYMDNPKERRIVREVFVSEYERRTTPLRLVAR